MTNPDRDVAFRGEVDSPFLEEELLVGRGEEDWEPRAAALATESAFQTTSEPGRGSGDSRETGESESFAEDAGASSAKEVEEWSGLDAEVDEVLEESAGTDESLELQSARDIESPWKPEELAEDDEDSHEAATISEECEGELETDDEMNDGRG